jgi:hypothetical protein
VYVPAAVSVKLNVLSGNPVRASVHLLVLGLGLVGSVTPLGTIVKSMSWMLVVSLLMNMMVVPGATVAVVNTPPALFSTFMLGFAPMPAGK